MDNKFCCICDELTISIDFNLDLAITSDAKVIQSSLAHLFCVSCGYIFVDKTKRIDFKNFYSNDYEFLLEDDLEPATNNCKYSESLVDFYTKFISIPNKKKFLDIGSGKGNFLEAMHKKFPDFEYYALEPSKAFDLLEKRKFIKKSYNSFFNANNFDMTFDYLSLIGVLEHVDNPKSFLNDIKKIMHEDTLLLIEVPNFRNNKTDFLTIDHFSKFTEESILNLFEKTGFLVLDKKVSQMVPMQFIVKKKKKSTPSTFVSIVIEEAKGYLLEAIEDAKKIQTDLIAIYGQSLILDYLINTNILFKENIICIIDDNILYQGKKHHSSIPIVSFDEFEKKHCHVKKIFLAMNDCYHKLVLPKLNEYTVYGYRNL